MAIKVLSALFLLLIVLSPSAYAQTDRYKEEAERFYWQCMESAKLDIGMEEQREECSCLSAHLQLYRENLQPEKSLLPGKSRSQSLEPVSDKDMLRYVYAPCLYLPARVKTYSQCLHDSNNHYFADKDKRLKEICRCQSKWVERYFRDNAIDKMTILVERTGNQIGDPVLALMKDIDYRRKFNKISRNCFDQHTQR